jgi:hypothetical protein
MPERWVNASHWYDLELLSSKRFDPEGRAAAGGDDSAVADDWLRARYTGELAQLRALGARRSDPAPLLLGEFGVPFDLEQGRSYRDWHAGGSARGHAFDAQTRALALMYDALDALLISATLWNYSAGNRNDARIGDGWNQEDFSVWSADQRDPARADDGSRAAAGFARPYTAAAQGLLLRQRWHAERGVFEAEILVDPAIDAPTELVLPRHAFPNGCTVRAESEPIRIAHTGTRARVWAHAPGPLRLYCQANEHAAEPGRCAAALPGDSR